MSMLLGNIEDSRCWNLIKELLPLRYMMRPVLGMNESTVRQEVVPDYQMEMFLKVTAGDLDDNER